MYEVLAAFGIFAFADFVYVVDHYFVHHNAQRYRQQHHHHHHSYAPGEPSPLFISGEFARYTLSGTAVTLLGLALSWWTGNWGFAMGGAAKWIHNYVFHLYQHQWAYRSRRASTEPIPSSWGIASAHYHRHHHEFPSRRPFTYAETWAGWDRLLERLDPLLVPWTANQRRLRRRRRRSLAEVGSARSTPPSKQFASQRDGARSRCSP